MATDLKQVMAAMIAAHADAKEKGFKKGNAGQSHLPCPVPDCGGIIKYSVASLNGHMWAACSNKECVRWME